MLNDKNRAQIEYMCEKDKRLKTAMQVYLGGSSMATLSKKAIFKVILKAKMKIMVK